MYIISYLLYIYIISYIYIIYIYPQYHHIDIIYRISPSLDTKSHWPWFPHKSVPLISHSFNKFYHGFPFLPEILPMISSIFSHVFHRFSHPFPILSQASRSWRRRSCSASCRAWDSTFAATSKSVGTWAWENLGFQLFFPLNFSRRM